jgi:hypothetical protein
VCDAILPKYWNLNGHNLLDADGEKENKKTVTSLFEFASSACNSNPVFNETSYRCSCNTLKLLKEIATAFLNHGVRVGEPGIEYTNFKIGKPAGKVHLDRRRGHRWPASLSFGSIWRCECSYQGSKNPVSSRQIQSSRTAACCPGAEHDAKLTIANQEIGCRACQGPWNCAQSVRL